MLTKQNILENVTYLDHAGATTPSKTMLSEIFEELMQINLGNPHSTGSFSNSAELFTNEARNSVHKYFNASPEYYEVIFTSGATAGIKLVGECFPWGSDGCVCYPNNAHTSLLGLRSLASQAISIPSSTLQNSHLIHSQPINNTSTTSHSFNLLTVPGECNFSGSKADLSCCPGSLIHQCMQNVGTKHLVDTVSGAVQLKGCGMSDEAEISKNGEGMAVSHNFHPWLWLLDAAKLAATSPINLLAMPHPPHFVVASFYKIFGYPTGLGVLLVRKDVIGLLRKRYFGGGTLLAAAADSMFQVPKSLQSHTAYEDGTSNFYAIAAIRHGFRFIESIGGMSAVQDHVQTLTRSLVRRMDALQHKSLSAASAATGVKLCSIFGRHFEKECSADIQGPVITFTLCWANGEPIGFAEVERLAVEQRIQLRTGCFCNVGACQEALGMSAEDVQRNFAVGRVCSDSSFDVVNGKHTGAVRLSFGFSSSEEDCESFLRFLTRNFLDKLPQFNAASGMAAGSARRQVLGVGAQNGISSGIEDICLYPAPTTGSFAGTASAETAETGETGESVTIAAMYVYPVKSCAGMRVTTWPVSSTGFLLDRHWALIDPQGRALTQKMFPRLALVQPVVDLEKRLLLLNAPGMSDTLVVPIDSTCDEQHSDRATSICGEDVTVDGGTDVNICGQIRRGMQISSDANRWFSQFLSSDREKPVSCALVRQASNANTATAGGGSKESDGVSFANTAQFLLLSAGSVRSLIEMITDSTDNSASDESPGNSSITRAELNIKVENFRPNLLVSCSDPQPHQEDSWASITVPLHHSSTPVVISSTATRSLSLQVTGPCSRCAMVNVNGRSGAMDCRAFQALANYRKKGNSVFFGQFLAYSSVQSTASAVSEGVQSPEQTCLSQCGAALDNTRYFLRVGSKVEVKHASSLCL